MPAWRSPITCRRGSVRGGGGKSGSGRDVGPRWPSDLAARVELRRSQPLTGRGPDDRRETATGGAAGEERRCGLPAQRRGGGAADADGGRRGGGDRRRAA